MGLLITKIEGYLDKNLMFVLLFLVLAVCHWVRCRRQTRNWRDGVSVYPNIT